MIHTFKNSFILRVTSISLLFAVFALFGAELFPSGIAQAQKSRNGGTKAFNESTTVQTPVYGDYKGVRIDMSTDEVRAKLGQPSQALEDQDVYVVSATETAAVFYDAKRKVKAISIDYFGEHGTAPGYREIVGADILIKPDGSMYKMVRFDQLGFWVSYNRTAGDLPIISVTIQKFR